MNKIFKRVGLLSLGIALAGGAAVALNVHKEAAGVSAAEQCFYTLDGTITGGSGGYAAESDITQGGYSWKVMGNTTMNPWRIGGNSITNEERPAYTTTVMAETVSKIEMSVGTASSITVSSIVLTVASDSTFDTVIDTRSETSVSANSTITFTPSSGKTWANAFYKFVFTVTVSGKSNRFIQLNAINFYKESTNPRGDLVINDLDAVYTVEAEETLSYTWTPASGSSATIVSASWSSNNIEVMTVEGNKLTAVAPGSAKVVLTAEDSLGELYEIQSAMIFVSNALPFEIGDTVALVASGVNKELSAINTSGSTHYGEGVEYSTDPAGLFTFEVEAGEADGSYSFVNDEKYLTWNSGNSLDVNATKSLNTSWYVIQYDDHQLIYNAASLTRVIWWNNGSTGQRFAAYERTQSADTWIYTSFAPLSEVPVRGTLSIVTEVPSSIRQNTVLEMQFNFVPADGDSATIASYTWSTNKTDVFTVSGDFVTASGVGKAKITINATDTNGQEYVQSTTDITVIEVVTGSYEKKTAVAVGDVVTLVCEADGTQIAGISSNIGTYVFYETAPADVFTFELEEGTADGSFAFLNGDKYLNWTDGNKITLADEKTGNSSWTIEFDGETDDAIITNVADATRKIGWNHGAPRFAAYTTAQTAIQLYGPAGSVLPEKEEADTFAQSFLDAVECHDNGATAPTFTTSWSDLADAYGNLSGEAKAYFVEGHADKNSADKVEQALARYDMLVTKYKEVCPEFISGRTIGNVYNAPITDANNGALMIIIASVALVSVVSVVTIVIIRKRRFHN